MPAMPRAGERGALLLGLSGFAFLGKSFRLRKKFHADLVLSTPDNLALSHDVSVQRQIELIRQ